MGKLRLRWEGPFEVIDSPGPNTYTLRLQHLMCISPVINGDLLMRFRPRGARGPVVDVAGEAEVEILVRRRNFRGRVQYLVRWVGGDPSRDEWRYAADLPNGQDLIAEFEARRGPAAPGFGRPRRAHAGGAALPGGPATPRPAALLPPVPASPSSPLPHPRALVYPSPVMCSPYLA